MRSTAIPERRTGGRLLVRGFPVDPHVARSRRLGRLVVALGLPFWLLTSVVERRRLERVNPRYDRHGGLFAKTVGPSAFLGVSFERLFGTDAESLDSYRDLLVEGGPAQRYFGSDARIWVVDDFYSDPEAVRREALDAVMEPFDKGWSKTDAVVFQGSYFAEEARRRFEKILGISLERETFYSSCDGMAEGWHGSYHAKFSEDWLSTNACDIHNHANLMPLAVSGLVYLDHRATSGTSFWARKATGYCTDGDWLYDADPRRFEHLATVPAAFNRLVLFDAPVLHRGEAGYGTMASNSRLFQTFFFRVSVAGSPGGLDR